MFLSNLVSGQSNNRVIEAIDSGSRFINSIECSESSNSRQSSKQETFAVCSHWNDDCKEPRTADLSL